MKPGEYVHIEIVASNVLTMPYPEIDNIVPDASTYLVPATNATAPSTKPSNPLGKFYF